MIPLGVMASSRQGASGPLVSDSFDRADSTTTMGDADTGQTWTPQTSDTWGIDSNEAYCVSGATASQAVTTVDAGVSDCVVEVTMVVSDDSGLCWRCVDNDNYWISNISSVYKRVGGSLTSLGSFSTGLNNDGDVLRVHVEGTAHTFYVNDVEALSTTDSTHQSATKHGLRIHTETVPRWDDFTVEAL